jgi:hypothetical protein
MALMVNCHPLRDRTDKQFVHDPMRFQLTFTALPLGDDPIAVFVPSSNPLPASIPYEEL